ncbi:MAG: hypothetical protein OHK0017_03790 [Patescibacteria group bacterium]
MPNYQFHKTFFVHGMHCKGCEIAVENLLLRATGNVKAVRADLKRRTVEIKLESELINLSDSEIIRILNPLLHQEGYSLSPLPEKFKVKWSEFKVALPVAIVLLYLFFGLTQIWPKTNFLGTELNYLLVFFCWSNCLAV